MTGHRRYIAPVSPGIRVLYGQEKHQQPAPARPTCGCRGLQSSAHRKSVSLCFNSGLCNALTRSPRLIFTFLILRETSSPAASVARELMAFFKFLINVEEIERMILFTYLLIIYDVESEQGSNTACIICLRSITRLKCRQSSVSEKPRTGHETQWGSLV